MPTTLSSTDSGGQSSRIELILVLATGVGHVGLELAADGLRGAAETLDRPQQVYNLAACVAWTVYLAVRAIRSPGILAAWGMRKGNFGSCLKTGLLFAVPASAALFAYGYVRGHLPLPPSFWLVALLYPAWGIAQQFALQALVTRNLRGVIGRRNRRVPCAGLLFSAAHFPNVALMFLTLPAGLLFTWLFERDRNLWAIGIVHGVLGAFAYYLVLGQDPGSELLRFLGTRTP